MTFLQEISNLRDEVKDLTVQRDELLESLRALDCAVAHDP